MLMSLSHNNALLSDGWRASHRHSANVWLKINSVHSCQDYQIVTALKWRHLSEKRWDAIFRTSGLWVPPRVMGSFIPGVYLPERQIRALGFAVSVRAECLLITKEDIWHLMDVPIEGLWGEYSLACSLRDGDRLGELSMGPFVSNCRPLTAHFYQNTSHGRVLKAIQVTSGNGTIDQAVDGVKVPACLGWMALLYLVTIDFPFAEDTGWR